MQPITVTVQIRFSDFDPFNHVNNVAYFELLETARAETVRSHLPRSLRGHLMVRHAACSYDREIRGGTRSVDVSVRVSSLGTTSFTFEQEILVAGEVAARGTVVMVALDDERRPRPLDDAERAALLS